MSNDTTVNHLSNSHYQILVIRLLVDEQGKLQQGVVIDVNEQQVGHFRHLDALPALVAHWLSTQKGGQSTLDLNDSPSH